MRQVFEKVKKATVAIAALNTEESKQPFTIFGSGFCVDPSGAIITCRHVIESMMSKTVEQQMSEAPSVQDKDQIRPLSPVTVIIPHAIFYDTTRSDQNIIIALPARARNITAKTDKDLGALQVWPHISLPGGYPHLEIEDYINISEGDDIGVCGFPLGNYLYNQLGTVTSSFTKGILSSIIPGPNVKLEHLDGFQLNVTATHGNSGGPVFSLSSGKVFGVLTLAVTHPTGGVIQGLVKAEPVYPVIEKDFLKRLKDAPEKCSSFEDSHSE